MVGRAAALAALLFRAMPACADESPLAAALRQFGPLGTWAIDCAHAPGTGNAKASPRFTRCGS